MFQDLFSGKICSIRVGLLVIFFMLLAQGALAQTAEPIDSVRQTVEGVISLLTDERYKAEEQHEVRRQFIVEVIDRRFNFELMSQLALGDTWAERSKAEQTEFTRLFSDLLKTTYIRRIESYSDEKVSFDKQVIKNDLGMVYTSFQKNNSEFSLIYKLKKAENDWYVYDVIIEGASIIKQYRRQFSQIIEQENFQGLMKRLAEKMSNRTLS